MNITTIGVRRIIVLYFITFLFVYFPSHVMAAEYLGSNIDGAVYSATAFSYQTSKFYNVDVEFDGDEIIVFFRRGGHIRLTLDDEIIYDPNDISAFDYKRGNFWDIDIDEL